MNKSPKHVEFKTTTTTTTKSPQSCPTLCDPIDGSPPASLVPGILKARTLEWIAISFSNAWNWKVKVKSLSRLRLLAIPWTAAYQAPPSMGFSRQEYWSGLPLTKIKQRHHKRRTLHTNISYEYKKSSTNSKQPNAIIYKKDYRPWSSGIFPK